MKESINISGNMMAAIIITTARRKTPNTSEGSAIPLVVRTGTGRLNRVRDRPVKQD